MSEFDSKAKDWDKDQRHIERAAAIADCIRERMHFKPGLKGLEFGAGTGLLGFHFKDDLEEIVLIDNSSEMIRICHEKVKFYHTPHIKPLQFDMEVHDYHQHVDFIFSQMVLHHVRNLNRILDQFACILNKGGYIAIADLYAEDGSFHDQDADVHHGFDPAILAADLSKRNFIQMRYSECYKVKRQNGLEYPVFLLTAVKI